MFSVGKEGAGPVAFQPGESSQVFVDDSGRRRRWVGAAGAAVTALCGVYMGIVVIGLSQTAVGPLLDVPPGGNGMIAGFPSNAGVPGLLAGGAPTPDRNSRASAVRPVTSSVQHKVATKPAVRGPVTRDPGTSKSGTSKTGTAKTGKTGTSTSGTSKTGTSAGTPSADRSGQA